MKSSHWWGLASRACHTGHGSFLRKGTLLKGLCCRMHTRCVREHNSPATPCPWSTFRHMQSTSGKGRRVWKATGTQAEGMKWCKMYQSTLLAVSAPERTLPPQHCHPVLLSLHFQWGMCLASSPEEQFEGSLNDHKAKGYFPAVQQECHIQCTSKWNGSECPDSTYFTLHYNLWILFGSSRLSCLTPPQFQLCAASKQKANVIIALDTPAFSDHIKTKKFE